MPREVGVSGRVVLACRSCGERVVLLGLVGDWYLEEERKKFECGCAQKLTLADRIGEVDLDMAAPLRKPGLDR
ncbi:MAG: hypothetical protein M3N18_06750 [Actinomycetota bacterium]|nr:hypothetical protein [Actinomycetota bacterium]